MDRGGRTKRGVQDAHQLQGRERWTSSSTRIQLIGLSCLFDSCYFNPRIVGSQESKSKAESFQTVLPHPPNHLISAASPDSRLSQNQKRL